MPELRSTGQMMAFRNGGVLGSQAGSFTLANGRYDSVTLPNNATKATLSSSPNGPAYRTLELSAYSQVAGTINVKVWQWKVLSYLNNEQPIGANASPQLALLATIAFVTDTLAVNMVGNPYIAAHTAVVTPTALGTAIATAYGAPAPAAYSPGSNTDIARAFISDFGGGDIVVECQHSLGAGERALVLLEATI